MYTEIGSDLLIEKELEVLWKNKSVFGLITKGR